MSKEREQGTIQKNFLKLSLNGALALALASCGIETGSLTVGPDGTAPQKANATETFIPTATSTETAIPTITETPSLTKTPTSTETATPTEIPVSEMDLEPAYTEKVSQEFMGVKINAELITDKSLDPEIKKVTVPETTYAEFIARTIFKVWRKKGATPQTGTATETDFKNFMALWAKAQASGDPTDWAKVQINDIWANDLNDGIPYATGQKPYSIWPEFSGTAPEGIRGIDKTVVVVAHATSLKNTTTSPDEVGFGTNFDDKKLYLYSGPFLEHWNKSGVASVVASIEGYLVLNHGSQTLRGFTDHDLYNLLINGGIAVN